MILLFEIAFIDEIFYITNSDAVISYNENEYLPAYIKVENLNKSSNIDDNKNSITITTGVDERIVKKILFISGFEKVTVKIFIYDTKNEDASLLFCGIAKNVIINENGIAEIQIFSSLDSSLFPREIVSRACIHSLYDENCGVNKNNFRSLHSVDQVVANVVVLKNGVQNPELYKYGFCELNGMRRIILNITGKNVILNDKIFVSDVLTCYLYYGCNKTFSQCKNKFNNRNCIAFDTVPAVNPVAGNFV